MKKLQKVFLKVNDSYLSMLFAQILQRNDSYWQTKERATAEELKGNMLM